MPNLARPTVHLIGSGPGDPDLLTVRADRLIRSADLVIYDRLVAGGVLDLAPPAATRIFAGKARGRHHMKQEEINALLARVAHPERTVIRLKGGDPLVFGRGSEEALYLVERGIDVEIVPGITAASGCAAASGIPLTHRGLATGVRFVTGHCREDHDLDLNWKSLADPDTTLVVYMGLTNVAQIATRLIEAGMPHRIPAAMIVSGTNADQQVVVTTLDDLPVVARAAAPTAPVLFVIGHVASLATAIGPKALDWGLPAALPAAGYFHA